MTRYVIDIETSSECDLCECGARVYAEHPTTKVLCLAYCDADTQAEPKIWSYQDGQAAWASLRKMLLSADALVAHNAKFEKTVLSRLDGEAWDRPELWIDTALLCGTVGRPQKLRDACRGLCLPEDKQKDARGTRLISLFSCRHLKTSKAPEEKPAEFAEFCEYCRQDVVAEREIFQILEPHKDARFFDQWLADCAVEAQGMPVDAREAIGADRLYSALQDRAAEACDALTGGAPLRSTPALRAWTASKGWPLQSFAAAAVEEALADTLMCDAHPDVAKFLQLRQTASGTAGKKFEAFINMLSEDGRCHGILASRAAHTGRYAGRGVQPQNMPRGNFDKYLIPYIRGLAHEACADLDAALFKLDLIAGENGVDALGAIIRDCIAPTDPGDVLVVSDYSAIEARVLAWAAGEAWVNDIFAGDGKIYERTAAAIYHKAVENVTKAERMAGKVATLALGYGGGVAALQRMAEAYGVDFDDAEASTIVEGWRASRPKTVLFWASLDAALLSVIRTGQARTVTTDTARFAFTPIKIAGRNVVKLGLPSGRAIYYWDPQILQQGKKAELAVESFGQVAADATRVKAKAEGAHLSRIYGGKLCENIVQAVAFDLLLESLIKLNKTGARIAFHVHDEIVVEARKEDAEATAERMRQVMTEVPAWARGLVLVTEPEIMERYKK